ncbi:hypothetical protein SAMN06296036_109155 [Pseudobacteriovorax antillogorgiicola]|uniref:Peptidase MA superfamily protein n=2 Tax=Pseudobacteriovorax antillogorgiicola TaxID=1513793 RepID=A0A1Y6BV21_9BACT|nr:hypothetical protein EDD56_10958 [Pseudobacteriovorax antillogorgiicola]SMF30178.1 hypothetical protein SAMN06296036_109155 [Pseudobacteriovorax antillogorgiicola]
MRLTTFAILLFTSSTSAFGIQYHIADFDIPSPTLLGFSHPKLSPHLRTTLSLRNSSSNASALEVLTHAGSPWDTCSIQTKKLWVGQRAYQHQRFHIICHGLPVYGAFISSHGRRDQVVLVQGAIPGAGASFDSSEGVLDEAVVREQMISYSMVQPGKLVYYYIHGENHLVPAYLYRFKDERGLPWEGLYHGFTGEALAHVPLHLQAYEGFSFLENPLQSELEKVSIENLSTDQDHLDGQRFSVYGADILSDRAVASENLFDYDPENEELFDQVQAYYTLERAREFFGQYFPLEEDPRIDVFTHTYLDNNAMYLPAISEQDVGSIHIGVADNIFMQYLNRDSDVLIHEYSHHIIYKFLTATWGESLTLHEGTADFFAYVLNDDPYLAESILVGSPYLRTAEIESDRKHDLEASYRGSHLLGQFWSAILWDLYRDLGSDALEIITDSLNYWPSQAQLSDAVLALVISDKELKDGQNVCKILELSLDRGLYEAVSVTGNQGCDLKDKEIIRFATEDSNDQSEFDNDLACGAIGLRGSSSWSLLLLTLPLLLWIRRSGNEA